MSVLPLATRTLASFALSLALLSLAAGCSEASIEPRPAPLTEAERATLATLTPMPPPPASPTNAWADDPKAAALGHALFFERRLSANGEVACATCHQPERWFTDGRTTGKALAIGPRNAPTALGASQLQWLFWDGRADSLWAQALGPLENPKEHGTNRLAVLHVIAAHHRATWEAAFGPWPDLSDAARFPKDARPMPAQPEHPHAKAWAGMAKADQALVLELFSKVGKAIAAYERRLTPGEAPFDRYAAAVLSGDSDGGGHLSVSAQRGLRLFLNPQNRCIFCHAGPTFSTGGFFNIGVARPAWVATADRGRYDGGPMALEDPFNCFGTLSDATDKKTACDHLTFLDPNAPGTVGSFKVPTLRNVAHTAPYMHAGQYATLAEVIDHYNEIDEHQPTIGVKEPFFANLHLNSRDKADLAAFLRSLSGPKPSGPWASPPASMAAEGSASEGANGGQP